MIGNALAEIRIFLHQTTRKRVTSVSMLVHPLQYLEPTVIRLGGVRRS